MIARRRLLQCGLAGAGVLILPRTKEKSILTKNGHRYWYIGQMTDEPHINFEHGQMFIGGALVHRDHGPAIEYANGNWAWRRYGKSHREGGPAQRMTDIAAFGKKIEFEYWYRNGELHRCGGPAAVWSDGTEVWYRDGKRHRLDGPAVHWVTEGIYEWYANGMRHRLGSPAKIYYDKGHCEWWEYGLQLRRYS